MGFRGKIIAATPLLATIVYLLLGFCAGAWHPGWIVFLAIPIVPMILGKTTLRGLYPLLVVIAYLVMGLVWDLWHPGWIIFLTIPVVEIFLPSKGITVRHNHKKKAIFVYDDDDESDEEE